MYRDPTIAGSWDDLVRRLDTTGAVARWSSEEPALRPFTEVADFTAALRPGADRDRADEVLGCLVRLAAKDGGGDQEAALLVLHLLSDGVMAMAARMHDLAPDIVSLIVGELAVQVSGFPWRRRTRAYAANLLLDTKAAVWRELSPRRFVRGSGPRETLVDLSDARTAGAVDRAVPGPYDEDDDLIDVLVWFARSGVAEEHDLRLLLDFERQRREGAVDAGVAARHGISERTLRRRRSAALAATRAARTSYLRAVA